MAQCSLLNLTWGYKIGIRKPITKLLKSVSEYLFLDTFCCRLKLFFLLSSATSGLHWERGVIRKLGKQRDFDILRLNWKDTSWQGAHFMFDKVLHKHRQLSPFPVLYKVRMCKGAVIHSEWTLWSVFCNSARFRLVYTYLWIHQ